MEPIGLNLQLKEISVVDLTRAQLISKVMAGQFSILARIIIRKCIPTKKKMLRSIGMDTLLQLQSLKRGSLFRSSPPSLQRKPGVDHLGLMVFSFISTISQNTQLMELFTIWRCTPFTFQKNRRTKLNMRLLVYSSTLMRTRGKN